LVLRVFGVMYPRLGKPLGVGTLPPTFIYFVALLVWISLACLVWLLAGVMALNPGARGKGLALALAMAATFPSVFFSKLPLRLL
jgi:hypothetical protein